MAEIEGFKQQCPTCETMVLIKDPKQVGKKMECPKCKDRFVVEAPADEGKGPVTTIEPDEALLALLPVRRRARDDEDDAPKRLPQTKIEWQWLSFGVGSGATFVLLFIIWMAFFPNSRREEAAKYQTELKVFQEENVGLKAKETRQQVALELLKKQLDEFKVTLQVATDKVAKDRHVLALEREQFDQEKVKLKKQGEK